MFARFAKVGFRREALGIVYGMAEVGNSVIAAGGARGPGSKEPIRVDTIDRRALQEQHKAVPIAANDPNALPMLGVGRGLRGTSFRIVDGDDPLRELPDRSVGEISIKSRCLFHGYYNNAEATAAKVKDGWYISGDLGYRADGILYVTGRKSDLIIIGGENIYPQDISTWWPGTPGRERPRPRSASRTRAQKLIVIAEQVQDRPHRGHQVVRRGVAARLNVRCDRVYIAPHKWLYKTSAARSRANNLKRLSELSPVAGEPAREQRRRRGPRAAAQPLHRGHRRRPAAPCDASRWWRGSRQLGLAELVALIECLRRQGARRRAALANFESIDKIAAWIAAAAMMGARGRAARLAIGRPAEAPWT